MQTECHVVIIVCVCVLSIMELDLQHSMKIPELLMLSNEDHCC